MHISTSSNRCTIGLYIEHRLEKNKANANVVVDALPGVTMPISKKGMVVDTADVLCAAWCHHCGCNAVWCYHYSCIEASPLSDPNSAVHVFKRTRVRSLKHYSATLWGYVPSVAKPIVGCLACRLEFSCL